MIQILQRIVLFTLVFALISGAAPATADEPPRNTLIKTINDYFATYKQRSNFERFMAFYADNAELTDVIYGAKYSGKKNIAEFLDWNRGEFELVDHEKVFTITHQTHQGNRVVTQGYFNKFKFNDDELGPWLFVMIHEFDSHHQIVHQTDWINYTPRSILESGSNWNNTIPK